MLECGVNLLGRCRLFRHIRYTENSLQMQESIADSPTAETREAENLNENIQDGLKVARKQAA